MRGRVETGQNLTKEACFLFTDKLSQQLAGVGVRVDKDANELLYGEGTSPAAILHGDVAHPQNLMAPLLKVRPQECDCPPPMCCSYAVSQPITLADQKLLCKQGFSRPTRRTCVRTGTCGRALQDVPSGCNCPAGCTGHREPEVLPREGNAALSCGRCQKSCRRADRAPCGAPSSPPGRARSRAGRASSSASR